MDYKYFVCITDEGRKLIANAIASETSIDFTHMSVGDANGTSYDPEPSMNALKHEVYKAEISSIKTNAEDNNILEFEFIVPASSGGYYIREAALYAAETVCAIARLPEQYKAQASEGAGSSMTVKLLIAVTSDAKVYINIPESLQYATQTYVGERIKTHVEEDNPHTQYVKNETYIEEINELKNNKADKTHNHELSSLNGVLPVNKGGTGTNNAFNFQNFFDYRLIGKPNATIQEFWDGLPRDFFGATYITEDTIRGLGSEYGILFFGKALNRRYLKFVEFSGNFGIYNEYVLIDNASKSNITFSDFIHTTLNSYPKRAYPFSGIRRYSSEFRTANEIHKLKMGIGDILSVNNTGSAEFRWNMDTRFPEGGQYYVDFYRVYINANNKIDRKWCGIYSGSASIGGSYDPNICFIGNIIKIS